MAQIFGRAFIPRGGLLWNRFSVYTQRYRIESLNSYLHVARRFIGIHGCLWHPRGGARTAFVSRNLTLPQVGTDIVQHPAASRPPENLQVSISERKPEVRPGQVDENLITAMQTMSATEILAVVMSRNESLDKVDLAITTKQLYRLGQELDDDELTQYKAFLASEPGFQVLCAMLALKGQYLEADIAADMFRFLQFLGLDSDSPTMMVYLQLMKFYINDVSLGYLVRLGVVLSEMTPSSQTKTLHEGLLVTCKLKQKDIEILNTWELAQLLNIFGQYLDTDICLEVVDTLCELEDSLGWRLCALILCGLQKMDWCHHPLEEICFSKILYNAEKLHYDDMVRVIESCISLENYDHPLVQKLMTNTCMLEKNYTFNENLHMAYLLCQACHFPVKLVTRILREFNWQSKHAHELLSPVEKLYLVGLYSITRYMARMKNASSDGCESVVHDDVYQLPPENKLDLAVSLHILGDRHSEIVRNILANPDVQALALSDFNCSNMLEGEPSPEETLSYGSSLECPSIKFLAAAAGHDKSDTPESILTLVHKLKDQVREAHSGNLSVLESDMVMITGTGVERNVQSRSGVVIDYVLPAYHRSDPEERGDVAVILLGASNFFLNVRELKGVARSHVSCLVDEGFLVIVINSDFWMEVPEFERARYLKRELDRMCAEENPVLLTN